MADDKHQLTVGELAEALKLAPDPDGLVYIRDWDEQTEDDSIRYARAVAVSFPDGQVTIDSD
jgi:hypothetical protein